MGLRERLGLDDIVDGILSSVDEIGGVGGGVSSMAEILMIEIGDVYV